MLARPDLNYVLGTFSPTPSIYDEYATLADAESRRHAANQGDRQYAAMSRADWLAGRRRFYLSDPLAQVTEADFDEALGCVPPLPRGAAHRDVDSFEVGEMLAGPFTRQFAQRDGRFFMRVVDVTDPSTWITAEEVDRLFPSHASKVETRRSTAGEHER